MFKNRKNKKYKSNATLTILKTFEIRSLTISRNLFAGYLLRRGGGYLVHL
jgi:hypothetical protein